jgi:hemolysin activation/secretion protein
MAIANRLVAIFCAAACQSVAWDAHAQEPAGEPAAQALPSGHDKTNPERQGTQAQEADSYFDILEYEVEGNTVLPDMDIERAVYPHLGEHKTIKDAEKARLALEKAYHDAGFLSVLVEIPEQDVDNALVRLHVTEGKVDRVRVTGSRYYSLGKIKERVPSLAQGNVPRFPEVQKELALLNRTPDRRVAPVLKPGKTPGTVDVDLKVDDTLPLHGDVELNNRYSQNTKPLRLSASIRYDNLWQREHSIALNFQTAPQRPGDAKVISGTYLYPVPDSDKIIAFYGVRSRSDVAAVGALNVIGKADIVGIRGIVPLGGVGEGFLHSLTFGVDHKQVFERVNLADSQGIETPINYTPFLVQYSATTIEPTSTTQYGISANFALRGWFGNNDSEFDVKNFNRKANYIYVKAEVARTQLLPRKWSLYGKLDGQIPGASLVDNEKFSAGGADSVRGYLESVALGDEGAHVTLELRTPFLGGFFGAEAGKRWEEFYALTFFDAADLRVRDTLPGQTDRFRLASAGFGLRVKAAKTLRVGLDVAHAFKEAPATKRGEVRTQFRVGYEF